MTTSVCELRRQVTTNHRNYEQQPASTNLLAEDPLSIAPLYALKTPSTKYNSIPTFSYLATTAPRLVHHGLPSKPRICKQPLCSHSSATARSCVCRQGKNDWRFAVAFRENRDPKPYTAGAKLLCTWELWLASHPGHGTPDLACLKTTPKS